MSTRVFVNQCRSKGIKVIRKNLTDFIAKFYFARGDFYLIKFGKIKIEC